MGQGLQTIAVIRVGVKRKLHKPQCSRTFGQQLAAPDSRFLVQALAGHNLVDQPHSSSLCGAVLVAQIPDLARFFLPDDTRQVHGAKASVKTPYLRTGLTKNGTLKDDSQITVHMHDMPTSDGIAIDLRDHGLRDIADHAMQVTHLEARCPLFVLIPALATNFLIAPGTEIALLAREDHHTDTIVVPGIIECLHHFINGPWSKSIQYPRTIDTYSCYAVLFGVYNIVKRLHVTSPVASMPASCAMARRVASMPLRQGAWRGIDKRSRH